MTYEVPVVPVSRSAGGRQVVAVVGAVAAFVLVAALAGFVGSESAAPGRATSAEAAAAAGPPATATSPAAARSLVPREPALFPLIIARPLPTAIDCHDVNVADCHRIVRAALRILPDEFPTVRGADAWRSLVCGDTFDCPPDYLRDSSPAGSVILRFDEGPAVAVNVVDWRHGSSIRLGLRAWLVRSTPASD